MQIVGGVRGVIDEPLHRDEPVHDDITVIPDPPPSDLVIVNRPKPTPLRIERIVPVADAAALAIVAAAFQRPAIAAVAILALLGWGATGQYRSCFGPRLTAQIPAVVNGLALATVAVAAWPGNDAERLVRTAPVIGLAVLGARAVSLTVVRFVRRRPNTGMPTVIVGAGRVGVRVANRLIDHPEIGLRPVGFVDRFDEDHLPLPVLGHVERLASIIEERAIENVIVAFGGNSEPELVSVLRTCERANVETFIVPRFFELGVEMDDQVWGIPMNRLRSSGPRRSTWAVKRLVDVALSAIALVVLTPMLLAIALAVKLTSPGPVLFRQQRVGQRGELFDLIKFRTLRVNEDSATQWTVTGDERVTLAGRVLRPTSLDELPQLFNVIRGDMSLVGPRPERPYFVQAFTDQVEGYADRHRVPTGITGLAQVNGLRGDTSIEERAMFDNHYIERWSIGQDALIMLQTIGAVLRPPKSVRCERSEASPRLEESAPAPIVLPDTAL